MTRPYNTKSSDGASSLTPPHSDYVNVYSLNGTAAATVTWPLGMSYCNISSPSDYWVRAGGAAVVPAAGVSDGTGSAYRPAQRQRGVDNGTAEVSFSIISNVASYVTIEFWGNA